ncbi:MAG: hypothetical protein QOJ54_2917, partial [Aliidongia sp.]|nr:hypothetical protein [Aliidongia sp.]
MNETNEEDNFQFDNEGKCCDAVIRTIESEVGSSRIPNSIIRNAPSGLTGKNVEVKLTIGCQVYALEHTRIFGFSGHHNSDHKKFLLFRDKFKKLEFPFRGHYYVYIPDTARKHFSDGAFFDTLTAWTYETAATLNGRAPSDGSKGPDYLKQDGILPGFDLTVKLVRREWIVQQDGLMDVMLYPPFVDRNPLDHQIEKALNKKCEQLKPHRDAGARSVLILEMVGCSIN